MSELPLLDDADVWRVEQDDVQRGNIAVAVGVEELEDYFSPYFGGDALSLEGLQERIAGIPADAVRGSDFFHWACANKGVTLAMIECILNAFPGAAKWVDEDGGCSPLHCACMNKNLVPGIVRMLLDRWPGAANHRSNEEGKLPLHYLCINEEIDEADALAILDLLLDAAPLSASADNDGYLPIHGANLRGRSYAFYKRLIDAYPESLRLQSGRGDLPIHVTCCGANIETVKYMLELYPESIHARDANGDLPIHHAALSGGQHKAGIIKLLLEKDPDCASKTGRGRSPLHLACLDDCFEPVRILFDAYPEAIHIRDGEGRTPLDVARELEYDVGIDGYDASRVRALVEFLKTQLAYARRAKDHRVMHTPDVNGWLPLHLALWDGACLGAIKLMIAGNCDALQVAGNRLTFPLHIACGFSSVCVVEYLLGLPSNHLHSLDLERDSTLHYACRSGNLGVVKCLSERGVPAVSEPNSDGKLPIHLLWENDRVDRISLEYVEAVWLLLLARPETVSH